MKIFNIEELVSLRDKFFKDPEWYLVEQLFMTYIEPMQSINDLNDEDDELSLKGEVKAKKAMISAVMSFFEAARTLASGEKALKKDPRDSNE